MGDGLVKDGIADAGDPLVDEIDDARLAGHDEFLVLRRRLDPVIPHELRDELVRRHEHDVRQEEVVEEHVGGRRVRADYVLVADAQVSRIQPRFQQVFQHLLRHAGHHRVPARTQPKRAPVSVVVTLLRCRPSSKMITRTRRMDKRERKRMQKKKKKKSSSLILVVRRGGMSMSCARVGADLLQDEDVSPVLLEPDRVGFDVAQDPVEVVLVYAEELTTVFSRDDRRRSAKRKPKKPKDKKNLVVMQITNFQEFVQMEPQTMESVSCTGKKKKKKIH